MAKSMFVQAEPTAIGAGVSSRVDPCRRVLTEICRKTSRSFIPVVIPRAGAAGKIPTEVLLLLILYM